MAGNRTLTIFLSSLAAVTVGVVIFKNFRPSYDNKMKMTMFDSSLFGSVDRLSLEGSGKKVEIKRNEKNEWMLEHDNGFPADANKISQFLDSLNASKIERTVARSGDKAEQFGLGPSSAKIVLEGRGKSLLSLQLGETRSGGGRYVKFSDIESVFLVAGDLDFKLEADHWAYRTLIKIPRKDIQSITWLEGRKSTGRATYSRKTVDDKFEISPAQSEIKEEKFNQIISSLENFTFEKRRERSDKSLTDAFTPPFRQIALKLFDGRMITLSAASPSAEKDALVAVDLEISAVPNGGKALSDGLADQISRLSDLQKRYFFLFPARMVGGN